MGEFWRKLWSGTYRPSALESASIGIGCVAIAGAFRIWSDYLLGPGDVQAAPFYPAVLFATLVAGIEAGILALILAVIFIFVVVIPPAYSLRLETVADVVNLAIYASALAATVLVAGHYRGLLRRLYEEEHHRKTVVSELGHRVKNKLATIYAIIRPELRGHQEIWAQIDGRLRALSATDDFISKADGQGAFVHDILMMELAPYDLCRFTLQIDNGVFCPEKPAIVLALILHELTTNAFKHGALSNDRGRIEICCSRSGGRITFSWVENTGFHVVAPARSGFGIALIRGGLSAYDSEVSINFPSTGLVYGLSFMLPEIEATQDGRSYPAKSSANWSDQRHSAGASGS